MHFASGTLLATGLLGRTAIADEPNGENRLERIGVQLSTVMPLLLADFEATLARVAEIGYREVEFSALGFLGRRPARVQTLLQDNGLTAPAGRVSPRLPEGTLRLPRNEIMNVFLERSGPEHLLDNVRYSIEGAQVLGQKFLNLPALMPRHFQNLDQVKRNVELLSEAGELCAEQEILFGYHNHGWELTPLEGVIPYDLMIEETDAELVSFQLDTYWIVKAGGNLADYLTRYPGRFSSCHLKDIDAEGDFADVGHGEIDFPAFTRAAIAQGAKHFFVERDGPPDPMNSIRRSYEYLSQMTF